MTNKCSNCGFEYGEFDVYCARCGHKIDKQKDFQSTAQEVYDNFINNTEFNNETNAKAFEFFSKRKEYQANIFDAFSVMFIVSIVLTVLVFMLSNKQTETRQYLQYKNYIAKPSLIPILENSDTIENFSKNISDNEYFLKLYLKYSKDDNEKKEQIFSYYINELSKFKNITNEYLLSEKHPECQKISDINTEKKCSSYFNKQLRNTGVKAYSYKNTIFLYPNKKLIAKKYSKLVSPSMKDFLKLEAKYNEPTSYDGILMQKPIKLTNKIGKYEVYYNNQTDLMIKKILERILYNDTKQLLFARNIYATTTQEMQPAFKKSFNNYIRLYKYSPLSSLFLSYLDKQKAYTDENFLKDYPYKIFEETFDDNVENTTFKDIFSQLRKNIASTTPNAEFAYAYSLSDTKWQKFKQGMELGNNNYIISYPDENNNVTIYNFAYSPIQELNIQSNSSLFINSNQIYIYNYDKLSIAKITFNGKLFNTKTLNLADVTSIFPGINVINIDSTNGYDIYIEKENKNASFIILSRYAQGLKDYELSPLKEEIKTLALSNMFSVDTNEEVVVSFHDKSLPKEETSEQNPTYKIHISTIGQPKSYHKTQKTDFTEEKVQEPVDDYDETEPHKPTIKPKINTLEKDALILPPTKNLEPPVGDDE